MKTPRGFEVIHFEDTYGKDCSIQESSAVGGYLWLGVHSAESKIMENDFNNLKEELATAVPEDGGGWRTIKFSPNVITMSRMHIDRKTAKWLADKLLEFYYTGLITDENEENKDEIGKSME